MIEFLITTLLVVIKRIFCITYIYKQMKYELCLTIKPVWYRLLPQEQHNIAVRLLEEVHPEYQMSLVAELTGEHNVHYHGIVELADIPEKDLFLNKFRGALSKFFGRKTCSQLQFETSYKTYMRKDLDKTRLIIKDPIVRDSFGVFKTIFE